MELSELIRNYKNSQQLTNEELASRIGVTETTIYRWLSGDVKRIQEEPAKKISELVGFDILPVIKNQLPLLRKPILGVAKAGYGLFLEDNYLGEEEVTLDEYQRGDYFLQVNGDSMIGSGILDKSLVYVKQTSTLNNHDIGVIQLGDEVTIKKYIRKKEVLILEASNPAVQSQYFTQAEVEQLPIRILGKVLYCKTNY
ncbi:MAG: XRE family transcriptional regulator [Anaerorhabdus sp.]|uniref:LexA family protein n=1 Tax=Anaerorhabdus sp. TaxID=1872524 RepID=UPI002FCAE2E3